MSDSHTLPGQRLKWWATLRAGSPTDTRSVPVRDALLKASLGATALAGVGTLSSFFSYLVTARYFGVSTAMDAYLTAAALPVSLLGIVSSGVGLALVPLLASRRADEEQLRRTHARLFLLVVAFAAVVGLVGVLFASAIVQINAPSLSPQKLLLTTQVQRVLWLGAAASLVANFLLGVRHFEKRFLLVAALPVMTPVCMIIGTVAFARKLGILALAWGYVAGFFLQCLLLAPNGSLWRAVQSVGRDGLTEAREFLSSLVPVCASLLIFGMTPVLDAFWAARLPDGSLSYLGYSLRIVVALLSITVQGVAVVVFPSLVDHAADGDLVLLGRKLASALRFSLAVTIPAACLLAVLRVPVLVLLFQRGSFDDAATQGVAAVLPWYLIGLVGMASVYILARGFFSLSRGGVLAAGGAAALVFYWALSGVLSARFSYVGIGVAFAIYWTLGLILASAYLHRRVGGIWGKGQTLFLAKVLGVSLLAALATGSVRNLLDGHIEPLPGVALAGAVGLVTLWGLGARLFRWQEFGWQTSETS